MVLLGPSRGGSSPRPTTVFHRDNAIPFLIGRRSQYFSRGLLGLNILPT